MSAEPKVSIHPSQASLAAAVAARLITRLVDVQSDRGTATVVLTGGSIGTAALQAVVESPAHTAVDWANVHFWWGDERFLRAEDPDRNAVQARAALLDRIAVDPVKIHEFGSKDEFPDEDAAAADYAEQLAAAARAELDADPEAAQADARLPGSTCSSSVSARTRTSRRCSPSWRASAPGGDDGGRAGRSEAAAAAHLADPRGDQHGTGGVAVGQR